jgi:hypothetical protein
MCRLCECHSLGVEVPVEILLLLELVLKDCKQSAEGVCKTLVCALISSRGSVARLIVRKPHKVLTPVDEGEVCEVIAQSRPCLTNPRGLQSMTVHAESGHIRFAGVGRDM